MLGGNLSRMGYVFREFRQSVEWPGLSQADAARDDMRGLIRVVMEDLADRQQNKSAPRYVARASPH